MKRNCRKFLLSAVPQYFLSVISHSLLLVSFSKQCHIFCWQDTKIKKKQHLNLICFVFFSRCFHESGGWWEGGGGGAHLQFVHQCHMLLWLGPTYYTIWLSNFAEIGEQRFNILNKKHSFLLLVFPFTWLVFIILTVDLQISLI